MGDHARRESIDVILPVRDRRIALAHRFGHLVPQHHRVLQRVRLGRACQHPPRAPCGDLEAVADDPVDAVPREKAGLLGNLVRRPDVKPPPDARVFALGVLADAHHIDVARAAVGERRRQAGQQSHRPEVHVLVEALPEGQNQLPHRHVIGDTRRADRPEVNGVERR